MTAGRASLSIDLEVSMTGETKESWMAFCEQAANGQDPKKLIAVANEINRLLQKKRGERNRRPRAAYQKSGVG